MLASLALFQWQIALVAALRHPLSSRNRKAYRLHLQSQQYRRLALRPVPRRPASHQARSTISDDTPIRVAAVSHNLNLEGAPLAQMELLVALSRAGMIVPTVFSPHDGPLRADYESAGIAVRLLAPVSLKSAQTFDQSLAPAIQAVATCKPDVVYANTLLNFWAIVAAERMKLPALWNIREIEPATAHFRRLPSVLRRQAYASFRHAHRVIFVSGASFSINASHDRYGNFEVIYDALDPKKLNQEAIAGGRFAARASLGLAEGEIAIVTVGTVAEGKGQLDLIEALTGMPDHAVGNVRVFIVGDRGDAYANRLRQAMEVMPASLKARIEIVAETPRPHDYLCAADIAVCCSRKDSNPRVVHEAMHFALPLITTLTCGCELVEGRSNALVYRAGDAGALATCLTRLVTDPALRETLAANSRRAARALPAFEEMVRQYGELFVQARAEGGRTRLRP